MKLKHLLIILTFIILVSVVNAKTVDKLTNKPLNITIPNCYSVNISAELTEGAVSDLQFVGCTKKDDTHFDCNCLNSENNNFSIIMRSEYALIRNIRYYDIDLRVKYFDTYLKTMKLEVEDGGDYYEVDNESWVDKNTKIKIVKQVEYVNQTVYEDKIVYVPYNVTVYKDRNITEYVNVTSYYENTTRIERLEKEKNIAVVSSIILLIILLILSFWVGREIIGDISI